MAVTIPSPSPHPWVNNGGQIEAADGTVVATVGTVNHQTPQDTANARLIVATHAMTDALYTVIDCAGFADDPVRVKVARALNLAGGKVTA